ncbi:hypothetical protein [Pajaroellobacter abortibovis]|uniref:Uncharacterized protein n=1 Tax=Pajaroellobacter abortibovis TaxID=1882918 RepID=A0A1L6MYH9_9BACT|nr:hypothetical protein [Pajaroellobacter abortibovis]APS00631.1 hypothetical protein BCY86_08065 [Pajaroellobacter abortibovis]
MIGCHPFTWGLTIPRTSFLLAAGIDRIYHAVGLLRCLPGHFSIDKNRIYVGGYSVEEIITNYVLQRRSHILARGIVASGFFSITSPPPQILDTVIVLVTRGRDNDEYLGFLKDLNLPPMLVNPMSCNSIATEPIKIMHDSASISELSICLDPSGRDHDDEANLSSIGFSCGMHYGSTSNRLQTSCHLPSDWALGM